jgi:hypothetical protein
MYVPVLVIYLRHSFMQDNGHRSGRTPCHTYPEHPNIYEHCRATIILRLLSCCVLFAHILVDTIMPRDASFHITNM